MNTLGGINKKFFFFIIVVPFSVIAVPLLLFAVILLLPYINIKTSIVFASPVIPGSVRKAAGFDDFEFSELIQESSPSAESSSSALLIEQGASEPSSSASAVRELPAIFTLSIPKLKIEKAKVETNARTLKPDNLLGHYRGTAFPGDKGNAFIYGHSALPIFFNPKDYKTIFSKLQDLDEGDTFTIDFAGQTLNYEVSELRTLKPSEVNVFEDKSYISDSTVTLMTCVPAGTKLFRLTVTGKFIRD